VTDVSIRSWFGDLVAGTATRVKTREAARTPMIQRYWLLLPLVAAEAVVAPGLDIPVLRPALALFLLLGAPTLLLYRKVDFPSDSGTARLLYSFGSSLLGLIMGGLAVNLVLPVVGVDRPLQPVVLATTWFLLNVGLLVWRADVPVLPEFEWTAVGRRLLDVRFEWAQTLAFAAVIGAVLGAVRLNNGAGGGVALLASALAAAALVALMVRPEATLGRDARCLALVGASLLLATSLRGWYITGHDIQAEFLAFQLTNTDQRWQMSLLENAYNACLSINLLPTMLVQATGLSGEVVFKVLLQLVFALVPVLTYLFARRFLARRLALVAATFTIAFPTFFTDMPYLVRQELAFFFLALLLLAATETGRRSAPPLVEEGASAPVSKPTTRQFVLVTFFGLGVVLSHYSTTYVMLLGLVFALFIMGVWRFVGRRFGKDSEPSISPFQMVLLNPLMVAFLAVASYAWAGPITDTGGHAGEVARETISALTGKGSDEPGSSDVAYSLFAPDEASPRERMNQFVGETMEARQAVPRRALLVKKPGRPELRPQLFPAATAPLTGFGEFLDDRGIDPRTINNGVRFVAAGVMQVLLLAGLIWLFRRGRDKRGTDQIPIEVAFVSVGAVAALGLIVLVPNLSVDYGVLRAFQQTMLVVSPLMAAGLGMLCRPLGARAGALVVAVPVVLLLVLTGVLPALIGGQQERIALANSGSYHDRFFASEPEIRAMAWVAAAEREDRFRSRIISNRNVGVRLLANTDNRAAVADRLYPTLLTRDGYVYVDGQITGKGRSTIFYTGDLLTYAYPTKALEKRRDLVYSSPHSRIYR